MDIEERAQKWVGSYDSGMTGDWPDLLFTSEDMIAAYLAGSAQTQADYTAHARDNT